MAVSDHAVTFLIAYMVAFLILGFHHEINVQSELRQQSLSLRAEQLQEDIALAANFSDGYIRTDLGAEYTFRPVESGFELSAGDRAARKKTSVDIQGQEFSARKICISKVAGGVKVTGDSEDVC